MARLQLKSEMQSRSRDTRATCSEECHTASEAVDLFVNVGLWCHYLLSPSVSSACVMWGEVSSCHHHARDQPAVCVYREPSQALRRRGENDTEALSSNPCGVNLHLSKFNWWLLIKYVPLKKKIFGIVILPFNMQKEFLMHLMRGFDLMDQIVRVETSVYPPAPASTVCILFTALIWDFIQISLSKLEKTSTLFFLRQYSSDSIHTCSLCVPLPPEIQPAHQCHSDKWIVTGQAYQCQCQAALWDFDSALFPQLNRRLCFAKQTNKQGTWRVWWKSKQHGPVTCPTTMTLPK